jgi:hypothetical protein
MNDFNAFITKTEVASALILMYLITGYDALASPLTRHFSAAVPCILW